MLTRQYHLRWFLVPPVLHLCVCVISYVGLLLPSLQGLGILFTYVLLADLPVSLPAYFLGWKYPAFAVVWVFAVGTFWWYLLGRGAEFLIDSLLRRKPIMLFPPKSNQ